MDEIENKETITPQEEPSAGLVLLPEAQLFLAESAKWAKFLGIMGFIGAGFMIIGSLFMGVILAATSGFARSSATGISGIFAVVYIPIAILYFFVALYLYQFGTHIKSGIVFGDSIQVSVGLGKLKSFFKLMGITTIVILVLYVLILIIMMVIGATLFSAFKPHY
jgi:hypothetical protein